MVTNVFQNENLDFEKKINYDFSLGTAIFQKMEAMDRKNGNDKKFWRNSFLIGID